MQQFNSISKSLINITSSAISLSVLVSDREHIAESYIFSEAVLRSGIEECKHEVDITPVLPYPKE